MREPSYRRLNRPLGRPEPDRRAGSPHHHTLSQMAAATILAVGTMAWLHVVSGGGGPLVGHVPYLGLDMLLAVPFAGAALWAADRLRVSLRLGAGAGIRA